MDDGDMKLRLRTLGEAIRSLRVERGFSLGEVAEATDLSTSFLSLVENGRSDISTGRLFRVARFLGVGLGDLLDVDPLRDVTVMRSSDRPPPEVPADGVRLFPVLEDPAAAVMAPVICEYDAGAVIESAPPDEGIQHFVFVVGGLVEITQKGQEPLVLEEGDSAYFRSEHECVLRNVADQRATMLWVSSPPALGGPGRR